MENPMNDPQWYIDLASELPVSYCRKILDIAHERGILTQEQTVQIYAITRE